MPPTPPTPRRALRRLPIIMMALGFPAFAIPARAAAQTPTPQNQLWDAAMAGNTVAMATALQKGAAVDSLDTRRNQNGRRALNWAAWFNHPAAIRFLIAHGATIDSANVTGFTPLHHTAENGSLESAQVLLELGADKTRRNRHGDTPLEVARAHGNVEIIALLQAKP